MQEIYEFVTISQNIRLADMKGPYQTPREPINFDNCPSGEYPKCFNPRIQAAVQQGRNNYSLDCGADEVPVSTSTPLITSLRGVSPHKIMAAAYGH